MNEIGEKKIGGFVSKRTIWSCDLCRQGRENVDNQGLLPAGWMEINFFDVKNISTGGFASVVINAGLIGLKII